MVFLAPSYSVQLSDWRLLRNFSRALRCHLPDLEVVLGKRQAQVWIALLLCALHQFEDAQVKGLGLLEVLILCPISFLCRT